ncbi:MAG: hypothetical protein AB8B93_11525 [Pseudomonadales bacterium]
MSKAEPVPYMQRTREYYAAQGYPNAYQWAENDDIPFCRPSRPLAESRVALITTASPMADRKAGDGVSASGETLVLKKSVYSGDIAEPPQALFTGDLSWDKESTHTEDLGSYFPLELLQQLASEGRIGSVAQRYHCVPTEYSQRQTLEQDAPLIRQRCIEDEVDVAVLVPL